MTMPCSCCAHRRVPPLLLPCSEQEVQAWAGWEAAARAADAAGQPRPKQPKPKQHLFKRLQLPAEQWGDVQASCAWGAGKIAFEQKCCSGRSSLPHATSACSHSISPPLLPRTLNAGHQRRHGGAGRCGQQVRLRRRLPVRRLHGGRAAAAPVPAGLPVPARPVHAADGGAGRRGGPLGEPGAWPRRLQPRCVAPSGCAVKCFSAL